MVETTEQHLETALARYDLSDAVIQIMATRASELKIKSIYDEEGLKKVKRARLDCRAVRVKVEATRKDLKADALAFGKAVDKEAKRLREPLEDIEFGLQAQEDEVARELAAIEAEKAAKEEAMIEERCQAFAEAGQRITHMAVRALGDNWEAALAKAQEEQAAEQAREQEKAAALAAEEKKREIEREAANQANRDEAMRLAKAREALELREAEAAEKEKKAELELGDMRRKLERDQAILENEARKQESVENQRKVNAKREERKRQNAQNEERHTARVINLRTAILGLIDSLGQQGSSLAIDKLLTEAFQQYRNDLAKEAKGW